MKIVILYNSCNKNTSRFLKLESVRKINKLKEQAELTEKLMAKIDEVRSARITYTKAKNELPAGDPQLDELKSKWVALVDELKVLNTVA